MKHINPTFAKPAKGQLEYWNSMHENVVTICTGLAGTGKTFLALNAGVKMLYDKSSSIEKIVIIRPYMQSNTGERIGYLPGTLEEKVNPYILSIKDNLTQILHDDQEVEKLMKNKMEFTILSMCRGRSFQNCFIIVEEAQNVPIDGDAMLMVLTRIGNGCKMVIQGDLDQCDIDSKKSGLAEAMNALHNIKDVGIVEMNNPATVLRSEMVRNVLLAFKEYRNG
jgi:phosphate starvation-inducible PhoH-like protein